MLRMRRSTFSVPYSAVSVWSAKDICSTLIPRALMRNIISSSSVKPQSRSNCSLSSRVNCSLFFAPGVVKLFFISAVVVGITPYICVKKRISGHTAYTIDTAELFHGFFHLSSVMSVYKDFRFCARLGTGSCLAVGLVIPVVKLLDRRLNEGM